MDEQWQLDRLHRTFFKELSDRTMTKFLQQLSELELAYLKVLITSVIGSRVSDHGMTSLNHDEERESLL